MGSKAATTLIKNIRRNLSEPVSDDDLTNAASGGDWTNTDLLEHLNKAKDRLWDVVRTVKKDYFEITGNTSLALVSTSRNYALPATFRELVYLKITTPGYETIKFLPLGQETELFKVLFSDPDAHADSEVLYYDVIGVERILFANFPPVTLATEMGFIAALADYTLSASSTSDLRDEWAEYIEAYATMLAVGKTPGDSRIAFWNREIARLEPKVAASVAPRQVRDPEYVEAYNP